jgi:hypothetical protein
MFFAIRANDSVEMREGHKQGTARRASLSLHPLGSLRADDRVALACLDTIISLGAEKIGRGRLDLEKMCVKMYVAEFVGEGRRAKSAA